MPILNVTVTPSHSMVARQGTRFQLLGGGEITVKFYGVGDEWEEELTASVGDSLSFDRPYARFEVSADYSAVAQVYAGFADMRRSRMDFTTVGASRVKSRTVKVYKGEGLLIEANRDRRKLTIKPLNGEVYVGELATSMNDKMPIEMGVPLSLDIQGALYAEISPAFQVVDSIDFVDVRIIEELN